MPGIIDKIKKRLSTAPASSSEPTTGTPSQPSQSTVQTVPDSQIPHPKPEEAAAATPTPTDMTSSYAGKCHCGYHEWTVELKPDQQAHILCHCDTCKILGGGAFSMNQIIPKSQLKITKGGEPSKYSYKGDSGNSVNCYYCPHCTTHIYHHQEIMGPDTIIARTALLKEGRDKFDVGAEIYGKAKMKWEKEVAQTFETLPPQ